MLFGIVSMDIRRPPAPQRGTPLFALAYRLYQAISPAIRANGWMDRALRIIIGNVGHLERSLASLWAATRSRRAAGSEHDRLLAVYSMVDSGLTFDMAVFFARAEMERVRLGLKSIRILVFVPPGTPIYQWRNRKIFHNMGGKPLYLASHSSVVEYVESLAKIGRIFRGIESIRVEVHSGRLFEQVVVHRHVFPRPRSWGGRFPTRTHYKDYLEAKYSWNGGREPVLGPRRIKPHRLLRRPELADQILATVNIRNQGYSRNRNSESGAWSEFLAHPILQKNFHFFVFNDAESPIELPISGNVTACDAYVTDNFRRSKAILNVGLHIGNVSGSSVAAIVSDTPYLYFGEGREEDWKDCLHPERYKVRDRVLLFDREKPYQRIAFRQDDMVGEFRDLLASMLECKPLLARYEPNFESKIERTLRSWQDQRK